MLQPRDDASWLTGRKFKITINLKNRFYHRKEAARKSHSSPSKEEDSSWLLPGTNDTGKTLKRVKLQKYYLCCTTSY